MFPQILYAKALDQPGSQALILRWGGKLYVGVTLLVDCKHTWAVTPRPVPFTTETKMMFKWEWCKIIDESEVESYMRRDDWQAKQIEGSKLAITGRGYFMEEQMKGLCP